MYREKKIEKLRTFQKFFALKFSWVLMLGIFVMPQLVMSQLLCEMEPATTDPNIHESNRLLDAIIIGVAIMIVLFTLIMSIKYLFKPGEDNPDHIKNIVRDEGF